MPIVEDLEDFDGVTILQIDGAIFAELPNGEMNPVLFNAHEHLMGIPLSYDNMMEMGLFVDTNSERGKSYLPSEFFEESIHYAGAWDEVPETRDKIARFLAEYFAVVIDSMDKSTIAYYRNLMFDEIENSYDFFCRQKNYDDSEEPDKERIEEFVTWYKETLPDEFFTREEVRRQIKKDWNRRKRYRMMF